MCVLVNNMYIEKCIHTHRCVYSFLAGYEDDRVRGWGMRLSTHIYVHSNIYKYNIIYERCNIVCVYIYGAAADAVWSLALNESRRLIGFDSVT